MFLTQLEVENWKCYEKKTVFNFNKYHIIKSQNGTGKTSIFEAILFAFCGKAPTGFNLNSVRYDDNKAAHVTLLFNIGHDKCKIERYFGGRSNYCSLTINDNVICESARELDKWVNKQVNMTILSSLWTTSLITNSVLSPNFFTTSIIEEALVDADEILGFYKSEVYRNNREISRFEQQNFKKIDIEKTEKELHEIEEQLKKIGTSVSDAQLRKAYAARDAAKVVEELAGCEKAVEGIDIAEFRRCYPRKRQLEQQLAEECKKIATWVSEFNGHDLLRIAEIGLNGNHGIEKGHCPICSGEIKEETITNLKKQIDNCGRNEILIQRLQHDLEVANSLSSMDPVDKVDKYHRALQVVDNCPNWKEIIDSYNDQSDKLWARLKQLQNDLSIAKQQENEARRIEDLRKDVLAANEKITEIKNWIQSTMENMTSQLCSKASSYLHSINGRYQQIAIYGKEFCVVTEGNNLELNLLPVARMSSGEKTMIALSLIIAIHSLFTPNMPLLFDETFSALDEENLFEVQKFLSKINSQIFIITHNLDWPDNNVTGGEM